MADLTATEKAKVKCYLGYAWNDTSIDPYLVGLPAEVYTLVQGILASIESTATLITTTVADAGPYKRVEEVEWRGFEGVVMLGDEAARLVRKLAALLGIPINEAMFPTGVSCGPILRA